MTGRMVLDASAALTWCFPDEASEESAALLRQASEQGIIVPSLWFAEVANAMWMAERRRRLSTEQIGKFALVIEALNTDVDQDWSTRAIGPVRGLCQTHNLTVYDAVYLDLAIRTGAILATNDDALTVAARKSDVSLWTATSH